MKKQNVKVVQEAGKEVSIELVAKSLINLSKAANQLNKGVLPRRAVIALLKDRTGLSKAVIEKCLDGLVAVAEDFGMKDGE